MKDFRTGIGTRNERDDWPWSIIPFLTFALTIYNTNLARGLLCIRWTLALFAEPNEPPFNLIVREGDEGG